VTQKIEIDDDVFDYLKQEAEPFVDTPNTVLRRLLDLEPTRTSLASSSAVATIRATKGGPGRRTKTKSSGEWRKRVPVGSILPEEEYEVPLLRALIAAGGSGASKDITRAVGGYLDAKLTDLDREPLRSGGIRWENRIQFVRLKMIERGYMERDTPRGTWAITENGRKYFEGVK
jgi:hypothetical protein